ncbi:MAG: transglycosylase SLT domain-containing protein [Methylococcaceae bacterium]
MAGQRQRFLRAEKILTQADKTEFLALSQTLLDYPLYPYLQFQWLKNNLQLSDQVLVFLSQFQDTRYAKLLKSKWLVYLAEQGRWLEFIRYYEADGTQDLECQYYWAQYQTAQQAQALQAAERLWSTGDDLPNACDSLLHALSQSRYFTQTLVWQRFEQAVKKNNLSLAQSVYRLIAPEGQAKADFWLHVRHQPLWVQNQELWQEKNESARLFTYAVGWLAESNLNLAISLWDEQKQELWVDPNTAQELEKKLALALAVKRDSRAYLRLSQLTSSDKQEREWRVRAALLEQNWSHVNDAVKGLTVEEQQEPAWQYWLARSLAAMGRFSDAQAIYLKLAMDRSLYGFMAADILNQPYQLADKPVPFDPLELQALTETPDFKAIMEFNVLNRVAEAHRQWWYAIGKLPKPQIRLAAKLAEQWQWEQIAIITLVKSDYWDDLSLRFPVHHWPEVMANAERQQLDPAVILGLIRQESLFDPAAKSAVGARGLMQLMPATARQLAREMSGAALSDASLFQSAINIRYGSYYLKKLLNRFHGHLALAIAAYNAGPHRVQQWLPMAQAFPADIWIETMPYKETRKYVIAVFTYAIIYKQLLQSKGLLSANLQASPLKLNKLLSDVSPL